jgi:predicted phage terminase large subunit-like protein
MKMSVSLPVAMRTDFNVCLEKAFTVLNPGMPFLPSGHLEMLSWHLRQFAEGKYPRLAICMPPRHLKSTIGSVALPAWILGRNPKAKIICASYGEDLAKDFSTQTRTFMTSPDYRQAFPDVRLEKSTDMHLRTDLGGERYTTTVDGPLTGKGGHFVIVDDPMKIQDIDSEAQRDKVAKWFFGLPTRLNDPKTGGILLIAQRLHEDDIVGRIQDRGGWKILSLPLIARQNEVFPRGPGLYYRRKAGEYLQPTRIGQKEAVQLRTELGAAAFEAQCQQNPPPAGSGNFDVAMLCRYDDAPASFEHIFFSVDVATVADGGDFSVVTIWGYVDRCFYLLDLWRKQVTIPQLRRAIVELDGKWNPDIVLVEAVGSGRSLCQELIEQLGRYVQAYVPEANKAQRFEAATLLMEKGQVFFPANAPWLETLLKELQAFPNSKYKDQADSISQMLISWKRAVEVARIQGNRRATNRRHQRSEVATLDVRSYSLSLGRRSMPDLW